jgi:hypothetical protein
LKLRILVIASLLVCLGSVPLRDPAAEAFPAFKRRFDTRYLAQGTPLSRAYGGRSTCNVCHVGGAADREHRNEYGQALAKLLDRADAEALGVERQRLNPQAARAALTKIDSVLRAVEGLPSGAQADAPTFGQLIRQGILPISPAALPPAVGGR